MSYRKSQSAPPSTRSFDAIQKIADTVPELPIQDGVPHLATFRDVMIVAHVLQATGWMPHGLDTPEKVGIGILHCMALGVPWLSGIWETAVIGNKPATHSSTFVAIAKTRGSDPVEKIEHWWELDGEKLDRLPVYRAKADWPDELTSCSRATTRRGHVYEDTFSVADAKRFRQERWHPTERGKKIHEALWDKAGPWQNVPAKMLQARSRTFALRAANPEGLRGLTLADEAWDLPARDAEYEIREAAANGAAAAGLGERAAIDEQDIGPVDDPEHLVGLIDKAATKENKPRLLAALEKRGVRPAKRTISAAIETLRGGTLGVPELREILAAVRAADDDDEGAADDAPKAHGGPSRTPDGREQASKGGRSSSPSPSRDARSHDEGPAATDDVEGGAGAALPPLFPEEQGRAGSPLEELRAMVTRGQVSESDLRRLCEVAYERESVGAMSDAERLSMVEGLRSGELFDVLDEAER